MASHVENVELDGLLEDGDGSESKPHASSPSRLPRHRREKLNIERDYFGRLEMLQGLLVEQLRGLQHVDRKTILRSLLLLAPSFFQPSYKYKWNLHATSWLDGVRGFAALFVYIYHFNHSWWPSFESGFASGPGTYSILQFSFFRIIFAGPAMVSVFFVVSGYALSCSPIQKIRNGDSVALFNTLVSSGFRRWFRLFLPTLVSTFITMLIARGGWWMDLGPLTGPGPRQTLFAQLGDWWWDFVTMSNPTASFDPEAIYFPRYGPQLWTIPREFRCSMILYLVMLCLAKTRHTIRVSFTIFFYWYTFWIRQWELALFIFGMLLADLQFLPGDLFRSDVETSLRKAYPRLIFISANTISIVLALLGLHILAIPANPEATPGYKAIWAASPNSGAYCSPGRFWVNVGSAIVVAAISLSPSSESITPLLQRPFRTRFAQYLGNISFGLYVTHYYPIATIGVRMFYRWPTAHGYYLALPVNTFLCIWISDLFWRFVDTKSVLLAKRIAAKCFIKNEEEQFSFRQASTEPRLP
jgi:peptidoglycan/LPS O-acetylase OafA/YrhL